MKLQDMITKTDQVSDQASQDVSKVVNTDTPVQEQKTVEQVAPVDDNTQQPSSDDLLSRVTRFIDDKAPANKSEDDIDNDVFNDREFRNKIDSLQDPELKQYMLSMRKTGVHGIQERLQEISSMRKELTALKEGMNPGWTPQRIQQLLNDKEFLSAAQDVLGTSVGQSVVDDDDEYVPESVKQTLAALQQENAQFKQQFNSFNQKQTLENMQREHKQLSDKYGNYDPNKVEALRSDLMSGKVQATSEHLYKLINYEENINNAYKMGLRDRNSGVAEKQQVSSFTTGNVQQPNTEIKPEAKESNKQFLNRIIHNKLSQLGK